MNAHFSPDGRYLTFMGRQNGAWHVFAWAIGGTQAPSNLTAAIGGRNGPEVLLRRPPGRAQARGDIRLATLVFNGDGSVGVSAWKAVTSDGWSTEESMPFLTPQASTWSTRQEPATACGWCAGTWRTARSAPRHPGRGGPRLIPGGTRLHRLLPLAYPAGRQRPVGHGRTNSPPGPRRSCRSTTARATIPMLRR